MAGLALLARSTASKAAELLVLRHEVAILRRGNPGHGWTGADRAIPTSREVAVSSSFGGERGGTVPILDFEDFSRPKNEVTFAEGRVTTRTYATRSFVTQFGQDIGHPSRYVYRVFDEALIDDDNDCDWTSEVVYTTPGGRKQLAVIG